MIDSLGVNNSTQLQASGVTGNSPSIEKDQFLKLLVAQMKYQDPMNPVEGTEFTSQLAQFSSLEQLQQVNENLGTMEGKQDQLGQLQMTNCLGKKVLSEGTKISVSQGQPSSAQYQVLANAESGSLTIFDETGAIVRTMDLGRKAAGFYNLSWDGKDMQGNTLPDGTYRFQTDFYDENGDYVASHEYQTGTVQGVSYESDGTYLDLGDTKVPMTDIIEVY